MSVLGVFTSTFDEPFSIVTYAPNESVPSTDGSHCKPSTIP
jgi:hypothetical protein